MTLCPMGTTVDETIDINAVIAKITKTVLLRIMLLLFLIFLVKTTNKKTRTLQSPTTRSSSSSCCCGSPVSYFQHPHGKVSEYVSHQRGAGDQKKNDSGGGCGILLLHGELSRSRGGQKKDHDSDPVHRISLSYCRI